MTRKVAKLTRAVYPSPRAARVAVLPAPEPLLLEFGVAKSGDKWRLTMGDGSIVGDYATAEAAWAEGRKRCPR